MCGDEQEKMEEAQRQARDESVEALKERVAHLERVVAEHLIGWCFSGPNTITVQNQTKFQHPEWAEKVLDAWESERPAGTVPSAVPTDRERLWAWAADVQRLNERLRRQQVEALEERVGALSKKLDHEMLHSASANAGRKKDVAALTERVERLEEREHDAAHQWRCHDERLTRLEGRVGECILCLNEIHGMRRENVEWASAQEGGDRGVADAPTDAPEMGVDSLCPEHVDSGLRDRQAPQAVGADTATEWREWMGPCALKQLGGSDLYLVTADHLAFLRRTRKEAQDGGVWRWVTKDQSDAIDDAMQAQTAGQEGELCQYCGRRYTMVWQAPDSLWLQAMPSEAGLLCPDCFDRRMDQIGKSAYWSVAVDAYPQAHTAGQEEPIRVRLDAWPPCPDYIGEPILFLDAKLGPAMIGKQSGEDWLFRVGNERQWVSIRECSRKEFFDTMAEKLVDACKADLAAG